MMTETRWRYFWKRLLLLVPTFLGITLLSFLFINLAPGGPLEQKLQFIRYGGSAETSGASRGAGMVSEQILEEINRQYGLDKPLPQRYWLWLKNLSTLNFGQSITYEEPVLDLIVKRLPVSLQFGLASFLFSYLLSVPLGMALARKANSVFDWVSQGVLLTLYGIPPLILAMGLILLFAGSSHFDFLPMGGLVSDNYEDLTPWLQVKDRFLHLVLPLSVYVLSGLTSHTLLMRNSMLEVIQQDYIRTARAKGLPEKLILFKHALRNAIIPMVTGMGSFLGMFLSGSLIIEKVFRIEGMGLLSYRALIDRDYNLIMGLIVSSSLALLIGRLLSDLLVGWVDPRVDFQ
jgi:microcin C transport system permease protein